jgi:predicted DNA binding CopG/RHH family protein
MAKYSEAQKKAVQNYQKKMVRFEIVITPEEKEQIQRGADAKGLSMRKYITGLVDKDLSEE